MTLDTSSGQTEVIPTNVTLGIWLGPDHGVHVVILVNCSCLDADCILKDLNLSLLVSYYDHA